MLFKTNALLLQYAELTTVQFASVKPTIRMVEQQHILPVLGSGLYTSLTDAYALAADENTLTAPQKDLLEKCRCVIGPLLCYYYTPKAEVKLSDSGAQRAETTTLKTAYQNQVRNFREQNLREGELATELLLQFLDEKKADYPGWTDTAAYTKYKSLYIKSGSEFNEFFTSHSPYRNYMAMRSKMQSVEENNIRPLLGDLLFDHLKITDQAGTATTEAKKLLYKIKNIIAYQTVAASIPFLNIRMDANGLTVMNNNAAQNDEQTKRVAADKVMLNGIIEASNTAAQTWVANVKTYLETRPADFIAYLPELPAPPDTREERDCDNYRPVSSFGLY